MKRNDANVGVTKVCSERRHHSRQSTAKAGAMPTPGVVTHDSRTAVGDDNVKHRRFATGRDVRRAVASDGLSVIKVPETIHLHLAHFSSRQPWQQLVDDACVAEACPANSFRGAVVEVAEDLLVKVVRKGEHLSG